MALTECSEPKCLSGTRPLASVDCTDEQCLARHQAPAEGGVHQPEMPQRDPAAMALVSCTGSPDCNGGPPPAAVTARL